jgi:hypothetical protein
MRALLGLASLGLVSSFFVPRSAFLVEAQTASPIHSLELKLSANRGVLQFDWSHGYLRSILRELNIPISSQVLVFSKTSVQRDFIGPATPRAIYFNDDVYAGWVPGGDFVELSDTEPGYGAQFFIVPQRPSSPQIQHPDNCLSCHDVLDTHGVPGFLMQSTVTDGRGTPVTRVAQYAGGHRTPLTFRWGGWYVTGTTSAGDAHRGLADLSRVDLAKYLSPHSDVVALLVLEHQVRMHNLISQAHRHVADVLGVSPGSPRVSRDTLQAVGEPLLEYMLFRDEAPLNGPVSGTSTFASDYQARGPRDSRGRSLRDLDLKTRLLKYPCSPLIYSASFDALPRPLKNYLWERLRDILSGADQTPAYARMAKADRDAVLEILRETKPEFATWLTAANWGPSVKMTVRAK